MMPAYASADMPADDARAWLASAFDAQAAAGDADALTSEQRADLRVLLSSGWWRSVFEEDADDDRDPDAIEPGILLQRALPPAVRAAAGIADGPLVLALYLRNLVNDAWAMAWDHELLTVAIETSYETALTLSPTVLDLAAWELLHFMLAEFRVETALLSGRLDVVIRFAEDAVRAVGPIVAMIDAQPIGDGRDALHKEARNELVYYEVVAESARIGRSLLRGDRIDRSGELDRLRARVHASPFNAMDASELRGHIAAVESINREREREWLHVEHGRVRIAYPFGILTDGSDTSTVIGALHEQARRRQERGDPIGPLPIVDVRRRLDLSDAWQGVDSFGRGYRGSTFRLGELILESAENGEVLDTIGTSIRVSQLGNHTIVFEIPLQDAAAYRVAEAVHLATPVFGDLGEIEDVLRMRTRAGAPMAGLPAVIRELLDDLQNMLDAGGGNDHNWSLVAREGSFGVVTTVSGAYRDGTEGREPVREASELLGLWGVQPLVHPLPSGAASIADWSLYDLDGVRTWSLLHLNSELLASNSNVTLLAAFGSPDFAVQEVESYLDFAHSMHGMYQGWQDSVREFAERIADLLRAAEDILTRTDAIDLTDDESASEHRVASIRELDELVRDVERTELSLQTFVQSNEAVMLFIESPAIVSSPPLRVDLDTILESNGYARLRTGFTRAIRDVLGTRLQPLVEVVHRRMAQAHAEEQRLLEQARLEQEAELARRQGERDLRNGRILEVLSMIFTVVGLSGLASVLQAGHPSWDGAVAWWMVVAILVIASVAGTVVTILSARRNRPPRDRDEERR